jgi:hypothetical protein
MAWTGSDRKPYLNPSNMHFNEAYQFLPLAEKCKILNMKTANDAEIA